MTCIVTVASSEDDVDHWPHSHSHSSTSVGVHQVTWQKLSKDGHVQNMATYSERFGQQVNRPFQDKVFFTEASLTSSSITLKNVTWSDSSCYICSFNAFPGGSEHQQTCLDVQGTVNIAAASQRVPGGSSQG